MPPSDCHAPQVLPPSLDCRCQSPLSVPRANTSTRPDGIDVTSGAEVMKPPIRFHVPSDRRCQSVLSDPRTYSCARPATVASLGPLSPFDCMVRRPQPNVLSGA